jgi:hypothetical protein
MQNEPVTENDGRNLRERGGPRPMVMMLVNEMLADCPGEFICERKE